MCLGIPGKILEVSDDSEPMFRQGRVSFGGSIKEISLAYVPDAKVNDYVIVHAGFALSIIDESEAQQVFQYLEEINQGLKKLEEDQ
jgi:hydrogenase expression/formation protein HypC